MFEELAQAKLEHGKLNHIIMNAALMACVSCKNIDRALAIYDEMVEPGGCGVDNVTYGTLLRVRSPVGGAYGYPRFGRQGFTSRRHLFKKKLQFDSKLNKIVSTQSFCLCRFT